MSDAVAPLRALEDSLAKHAPADAAEARDLEAMRSFVARHRNPFDRHLREGHLTGSAVVVDRAGRRTVLLHHRKLARWLQPGGHAEASEQRGEGVALREAEEETGLRDLELHPAAPRPLDIDIHEIPARPGEPAHLHLDLRYLVVADGDEPLRCAAGEAHQVRWFAWEELESVDLDPGLRRALAKVRTWTG